MSNMLRTKKLLIGGLAAFAITAAAVSGCTTQTPDQRYVADLSATSVDISSDAAAVLKAGHMIADGETASPTASETNYLINLLYDAGNGVTKTGVTREQVGQIIHIAVRDLAPSWVGPAMVQSLKNAGEMSSDEQWVT
jgi:hypothetical protein